MLNAPTPIQNFTRGGQVLLHNFRMIKQIFDRVLAACGIFFLVVTGGLVYIQTTPYERYLVAEWGYANIISFFDDKAKQKIIDPAGQLDEVYATQVLDAPFIQQTLKNVSQKGVKSFMEGIGMTLILFFIVFWWLRKRGEEQSELKQIRGDEIADWKTVKKLILRSGASDIKLAELPLPKDFECGHVLVHGTTGSGKSVCLRELLDQIRARGERAIIYDKGCEYTRDYYREGKDILLNPLDCRTVAWNLWEECRRASDYDSLAAALIPAPIGASDPFWVNAARTLFSAAARKMASQKDRSIGKLLKYLLSADISTVEDLLRGTEAEALVSEKVEKMVLSVKSVLVTYLKGLQYVKEDKDAFSIRKWVQSDENSSWLFLSSLKDSHETLKPLISLWLDLSLTALLSLDSSPDRRIWVIIDELPSLQRLPCLAEAFAESRKYGGCIVVAIQGISQLRKVYGSSAAEEISGLCNTRIFFRAPSSETAYWVSHELGQSEIEEVKEGISYSESAMRSGISIGKQQSQHQMVSTSEIMRLNSLEAYIRLPGQWPITKIQFQYKYHIPLNETFIQRDIDGKALTEKKTDEEDKKPDVTKNTVDIRESSGNENKKDAIYSILENEIEPADKDS